MASVTLPRGVLIALVAALLACLGITAFLAGRASVPPRPAVATTPALSEAAGPAVAPDEPAQQPLPAQPRALPMPPALELSTQALEPPPEGGGPTPPGPQPEATRVGVTVVPSLAPPPPGEAARVRRYFQEMETAQAAAKYWGDPQALAGSLVEGLSKGDRSGIDQLLAATRGAHARMQAITVPADCAEHHRRSLDLVAQGASMLEAIASGVTSGDVEGFGAFPARARQLEADAKDVDALAARIKQRYGIS
jgi:hypothetical protein